MNKNNPKISVIIPLYHHEKYIEEAIYSVLEQTFSDFELIIINDGSTDKSEEVVKSIKDDRIKYCYQDNQGAHNTINRGIQLAQGEYVSILNSDDVYYKNRFVELLEHEYRRRLSHYENLDKNFMKKYQMAFKEFETRNIVKEKNYSWDVESDSMDWEQAIDGIKTVKRKLQELNAIKRN